MESTHIGAARQYTAGLWRRIPRQWLWWAESCASHMQHTECGPCKFTGAKGGTRKCPWINGTHLSGGKWKVCVFGSGMGLALMSHLVGQLLTIDEEHQRQSLAQVWVLRQTGWDDGFRPMHPACLQCTQKVKSWEVEPVMHQGLHVALDLELADLALGLQSDHCETMPQAVCLGSGL